MNPQFKSSKGLNLIELLLVLGCVALLLLAAFVVYPQVRNEQESQEQSNRWTAMLARTNSALTGINYYGLTRNEIIEYDIFTESQLSTPWGIVDFSPTYDNGYGCTEKAGCKTYTLTYYNIPPEVCLKMVPSIEPTTTRIRIQGDSNIIIKGAPAGNAPQAQLTPNLILQN